MRDPKRYYADASGEQYIDYVKRVYGDEACFIWCVITSGKYLRRMGKKDDNSEAKDLKKACDYIAYAKDCDYARTVDGIRYLARLEQSINERLN